MRRLQTLDFAIRANSSGMLARMEASTVLVSATLEFSVALPNFFRTEHKMEWSSLALWADSFMSSFTPRISADVRLLIGHVLLTFSGWLNCALALFVGASVFVAGNKLWAYSYCVPNTKRV